MPGDDRSRSADDRTTAVPGCGSIRELLFGSERLWTALLPDGTWRRLPRNADGYRQKIFWWHPGFDGRVEPVPDLKVSGQRLDAPGTFAHSRPATNARHDDFGGWTILTGIDVPSLGCWELTGVYKGERLTFVVLVTD